MLTKEHIIYKREEYSYFDADRYLITAVARLRASVSVSTDASEADVQRLEQRLQQQLFATLYDVPIAELTAILEALPLPVEQLQARLLDLLAKLTGENA